MKTLTIDYELYQKELRKARSEGEFVTLSNINQYFENFDLKRLKVLVSNYDINDKNLHEIQNKQAEKLVEHFKSLKESKLIEGIKTTINTLNHFVEGRIDIKEVESFLISFFIESSELEKEMYSLMVKEILERMKN